jgi:hypothetical protein
MAAGKGHARGGDIAIILSADEVEALETAIREWSGKADSPDVSLLETIATKIREAKGKML